MTPASNTPPSLQVVDLANTILAISRQFISSKPYDEVLKAVCGRIAGFVRCFAGPDVDVWYVFPNVQLPETRLFRFPPSAGAAGPLVDGGPWQKDWDEEIYQFRDQDMDALCALISRTFEDGGVDAAMSFVEDQRSQERTFVAVSLCRLVRPMGHVLLPVRWQRLDAARLKWHLHHLQRKTFDYFEAFYQATARTYLPSFYQRRTKPAAILFCDLRNSTTVFQVLRIGGEAHIRKFLAFLKAFMRLAAEYIVSSGLGTMYGFTGDGFTATFGDHLVPRGGAQNLHAAGASALALFVAERLHRGFVHLYDTWREGIQSFDLEYNEDVGVRLGIGLAYGNVHFDEFGTSRRHGDLGTISRGLLYYNAVGDHMNVAARLCRIANAELSLVDVIDRPRFSDPNSVFPESPNNRARDMAVDYIAPIVATKPLAFAQASLERLLPQPVFTTVRLKGIGNRIPVLEIWPESLNLKLLPEEAVRRSKFPPEKVAHLMAGVTDDQFYAEQLNAVGASEAETVCRIKESLSSELREIASSIRGE